MQKRRSIAVDDETWSKLETLAKKNNRSLSQFIRLILIKYLRGIK